jgi:hypothetical protein
VPSDLRLVAHPAQGHPDEGAPEGAGHRLAQGGLAHPWRADQRQDGTGPATADRRQAALGLQLAHGQVLEDAVLHVVEAVVVLVEDAGRLGHVEPVLGLLAPGQLEHGVQPGAYPSVFGVLLAHPLELVDLAVDGLADPLGEVAALGLGPVVVGLTLVAGADLAELLPDGLELAPQQELALGLYALSQGDVGQDVPRPGDDQLQSLGHVEGLEDLDLLLQREVRRVAGHIGDPPGLGDIGEALGDAPGTSAQQDVLQHGPVLAGELGGLVGGR